MKKTVERKKNLPPFSIDMGELEILWARLLELFAPDNKIYTRIEVKLPLEELEFDSIEELKQYPQLKGSITEFSICFSQGRRSIRIRPGYFFNTQMVVSASGESESWSAGAVETIFSFLQNHKVWYHWFVTAPIGWILLLLANAPSIATLLVPSGVVISKFLVAGWLAITVAIAIPYLWKKRLLPMSVICITKQDGFIKKYGVELSLIVAIISAVLTAIGLYFSIK